MSMLSARKNLDDELITKIYRTAIDSSGRLGSLYDGYRDRVVEQREVKSENKICSLLKLTRCVITNGSNDPDQNILRIISVEDELRVSILLEQAEKSGIAEIIDYSHPINENTRFFLYSYLRQEERLHDHPRMTEICGKSFVSRADVTHIIAEVLWGTDVIIILQLPSNREAVTAIDDVLHKVCAFLRTNNNTYEFTTKDKSLLEKITCTKVYSNVPDLKRITTIGDVYYYITRNKQSTVDHPISYCLQSIKWFYPNYYGQIAIFTPLTGEVSTYIEEYIIHLTTCIKILEALTMERMPEVFSGNFKKRFSDVEKQWMDVKKRYSNEIIRISNLVIETRRDQMEKSMTGIILENNEQMILKKIIQDLMQYLNNLKQKGHSTSDSNRSQTLYYISADQNVHQTDNVSKIQRKLFTHDQPDQTFPSNTTLHTIQRRPLHFDSIEAPKNTSNLRFNYRDFPRYSSETSDKMLLPSQKSNRQDTINHTPSLSFTRSKTYVPMHTKPKVSISPFIQTHRQISPSSDGEVINILLLGETGVGKSTFINAFANYLTFNTLANAQTSKPVFLIPVSFLITVGDNFEEHMVKFGNTDDSNNEDFDHPGQSVTQHCKTHTLHVNRNDGKKLCIIDTPGFGDTRGIDQDDRNMRHTLEYIKSLTHLNAVCFLLKPNESRLNIFFRSCLTQLFGLLGPDARNNIIFCFTNARSSFYTPGDTAPLLKSMLGSLPIGTIPFKKENTFCFDNESFRYLMAVQNKIRFNDEEKHEYGMSWSTSVTESNRLIEYIITKLTPHRMRHK